MSAEERPAAIDEFSAWQIGVARIAEDCSPEVGRASPCEMPAGCGQNNECRGEDNSSHCTKAFRAFDRTAGDQRWSVAKK